MHKNKKRFGQNFLIDKIVIDNIINTIAVKKTDNVVEIGVGLGALTLPLLKKLTTLHIIEIDVDLILHWQTLNIDNLIIHQTDVLAFDFTQLGSKLRIIGNLPYNISTPILFKMIDLRVNVLDMTFMLQEDVVARIVANCGNKVYGRLSVMIQAFFQVEKLFTVQNSAFNPPPKVNSAIIYLCPIQSRIKDINWFTKIVKTAFATRRKTLNNCLKAMILQKHTKINLNQRAEDLSVKDFIQLTEDYNVTQHLLN